MNIFFTDCVLVFFNLRKKDRSLYEMEFEIQLFSPSA